MNFKGKEMKNIVILYDIENLVGGHHLKYLSELSLKNILNNLKSIDLQKIAIQKAYADWSRRKLQSIKNEIVELSIDAVQMYGFSKGNLKNASDIQLVIDAMDILHKKDFITTFIIISGDGGFGTLVKKLKEYGKKVIGVAYRESSNVVFVNNCDEFYYINDFLSMKQQKKITNIIQTENQRKHISSDPILNSTLPYCDTILNYDLESLREGALAYMKLLVKNNNANYVLHNRGLSISILKTAFKYIFKDFDLKIKEFGFNRFPDFLADLYKGSDFKVIFYNTDYRVIEKTKSLNNFRTLKKDGDDFFILDTNNQINDFKEQLIFSHSLLKETLPNFETVKDYDLDKLQRISIKFINFLSNNPKGKEQLQTKGLNITILKSAFTYIFKDFDLKIKKFGFLKFLNFLQFTYKDSNYKLIAKETDYRLVPKNVNIKDFKDLDMNYTQPKLDSLDFYISILENNQPIFFIPKNIKLFHKIVDYIFQNQEKFSDRYFHDFEYELMQFFKIQEDELNKILLLFINSQTLLGDNSSIDLKEQNYTLTAISKYEFFENLTFFMKQKITHLFNTEKINDMDFQEIIKFLKVPEDLYPPKKIKDKKKSKSKKKDKKSTKKDQKNKTSKSKKSKKSKKKKKAKK